MKCWSIEEMFGRPGLPRASSPGRSLPRGRTVDMDDPIRIRKRQWLEEYGVDDAENGGVRSDGERERCHDNERNARRMGETPRCMLEISDHHENRTLDYLKRRTNALASLRS